MGLGNHAVSNFQRHSRNEYPAQQAQRQRPQRGPVGEQRPRRRVELRLDVGQRHRLLFPSFGQWQQSGFHSPRRGRRSGGLQSRTPQHDRRHRNLRARKGPLPHPRRRRGMVLPGERRALYQGGFLNEEHQRTRHFLFRPERHSFEPSLESLHPRRVAFPPAVEPAAGGWLPAPEIVQ